ncbi:MAG TPA: O-antigen ligase family protein [Solirubrobacterales bacterium]|nr:O-antigen ligase family protein [Solirubrobacterales bacterium]
MNDFLAGAGLLIAAGASAAAILLPAGRPRSLAMLVAIGLFPVLVLGDQWHTHQIVDIRHDEERIVALLAIAAATVGALAFLFRRWPVLLPLAIVAALPFRVPLHAGGDTANLLVPLYLVIGAAVLATALRDWSDPRPTHPARPLAWLLAAAVVLYALQALDSDDFSKGLQNVCFFFVPFTVAYRLLREVEWDRRLLVLTLWVVGVEATAFVLVGSVEYLSRDLFWNDQVIRSNEFHTYFRVNSIFWDPNVYGRYLALVIVIATAALLWARERRDFALLTALIGILWVGLAQTYSESSFLALLAGLAVLAALRWNWRWTLGVVAIGAVAILAIVGATGKLRLNVITSGRADLVSGGLDLWTERPLWGYGSGSFQAAYRDHRENQDAPVSISHTEPVTVLAEQGLVGFALYIALIAVALWTMTSGIRGPPVGGEEGESENGASLPRPQDSPSSPLAARAAVLAAFIALLVHTMAYAGFFEDPITWVLLAVGASLATAPAIRDAP